MTLTFNLAAADDTPANEDKVEAAYAHHAMGSLFVACFSNAMMLSMMWEHFHRAGYVALSNKKKGE